MRLHPVRARVLHVHENEVYQSEIRFEEQRPQPEKVDGQGEQQTARGEHQRHSVHLFRVGPVSVSHPSDVSQSAFVVLVHDDRPQPGSETRAGHDPHEQTFYRRRHRMIAKVFFQIAHDYGRHVKVVNARHHQ